MPPVDAPSSDVVYEGWLSRPKSIFLGGNRRRFVVIDRQFISQYKSVEDRHQRMAQPTEVTELTKVRCCTRRGSRRFALQLLRLPNEKGKVVDFLSASKTDNDTWLLKIESALDDCKNAYGMTHRQSYGTSLVGDDVTQTTASPSACSQFQSERSINLSADRRATLDASQQRSSPSSQRPSIAESPPSNANRVSPPRTTPQVRSAGQHLSVPSGRRTPTDTNAQNFEPGTRVQFGQINRFGIIEERQESCKFLVRIEGRDVILSLPAELLSCASDDQHSLQRSLTSLSATSHEPPPPQHLASELSLSRKDNVNATNRKKLNYAMRHLVVEKYTAARRGKDSDDTERECSICCMEYDEGDNRLRLPCLHVFHDVCVRPWFDDHENCPVCSISVVEALAL